MREQPAAIDAAKKKAEEDAGRNGTDPTAELKQLEQEAKEENEEREENEIEMEEINSQQENEQERREATKGAIEIAESEGHGE